MPPGQCVPTAARGQWPLAAPSAAVLLGPPRASLHGWRERGVAEASALAACHRSSFWCHRRTLGSPCPRAQATKATLSISRALSPNSCPAAGHADPGHPPQGWGSAGEGEGGPRTLSPFIPQKGALVPRRRAAGTGQLRGAGPPGAGSAPRAHGGPGWLQRGWARSPLLLPTAGSTGRASSARSSPGAGMERCWCSHDGATTQGTVTSPGSVTTPVW